MNAPFALDNRMTIVLFAGMGGGCDGLEDAGFHVHVAINHDPVAVAVHERRHPHTRHLRCDVFEADPRKVTGGRGVRVLHASPDCTHFSVAKGSKPVSKRRRSLAWVICRWAGTVRPETITMENVQEIMTWGPLVAKRDPATGRVLRLDGSVAAKGERVPVAEQWLVPDPRHKGRIWRAWRKHLTVHLGYNFDHRVLVCADYGVPTIRKRFFGVAKADGSPIAWPARTHAPRKHFKQLGLRRWIGAPIDWSLPVKSIFNRKKPLAEATLRRIARGVMRYVVLAAKPFIVPITHAGDKRGAERVHDADDPLRALTTANRGELAAVAAHLVETAHGEVSPGGVKRWGDGIAPIGEPAGAAATSRNHALVAAHLTKFNQNGDGSMPDEPLPTAMAGAPRNAVVAAHVTKFRTGSTGSDIGEPLPTFTANSFEKRPGGAVPLGLVGAALIQTGYGERKGQAPRSLDIEEPMGSQVGGAKHALVGASLVGVGGRAGQSEPRSVEEPLGATTTKEDRVLVAAHLVGLAHGESGKGGRNREYDAGDPLRAIHAGGGNAALVGAFLTQHNNDSRRIGGVNPGRDPEEPAATLTVNPQLGVGAVFLAQNNTGEPGRSAEDPVSTIVTLGSTQGVVAASLLALRGTNADGRDALEPLAAIMANGNHAGVAAATLAEMRGNSTEGRSAEEPAAALTGGSNAQLILAFLQSYYSTGQPQGDVLEPLGGLTGKVRHGLVEVMVRGVPHYIDDIGIRMLEPEEGAAAHGFKPGALPDEITIDGRTRRLTKTEKYHLVGNSVPPRMIMLLAELNVERAFAEAAS